AASTIKERSLMVRPPLVELLLSLKVRGANGVPCGGGRHSGLGPTLAKSGPELTVLLADEGVQLVGKLYREVERSDQLLHVGEILESSGICHPRGELEFDQLGKL